MQKHLSRIIDDFQLMPKSIVEVVAAYILYLMLESKGHQPRFAARLSGKHESSFSRMLNRSDDLTIAKGCLNRAVRRRLGKKTVRGHKIVNFVLVLGEEVIPLSAVAHYSQGYCEENGFTYKTENELVIDWLNWLHASDLFPREIIKHLHFVCDAGYDAKKVQKAINRIGCHFTMCIKCNRQIDGMAIDEYFRRQRIIPSSRDLG